MISLATWTHKLGGMEVVLAELERAFQSWTPYTNLKFVYVEDYHAADIRVVFGRYHHGDRLVLNQRNLSFPAKGFTGEVFFEKLPFIRNQK